MRAKDAKTISICDYLLREWHKPLRARVWGREQWYSSPLRAGDSNPSFKVDTQLNLWFDHGLAIGGDVINLACELHKTSTKEALAILESSWLASHSWSYNKSWLTQSWLVLPFEDSKIISAGEKEKEGYFEITKVGEIQSPALFQYLESRKIDLNIAKTYLKEIRFKPRNQLREYFALGWANWNGFEARSKLFKGFVGTTKDITRIGLADGNSLSVFEGFFDYLAFLSHHNISEFQNSAIILNSTSLRKRALAEINQFNFSKVYLFLDNDVAGDDCKQFFKLGVHWIKVIDKSFVYENHKDFNAWSINRKR
jgi:hypothetical protein